MMHLSLKDRVLTVPKLAYRPGFEKVFYRLSYGFAKPGSRIVQSRLAHKNHIAHLQRTRS